jgi:5-methylthioadenosine/S-adenosylhomocysteine deaminase
MSAEREKVDLVVNAGVVATMNDRFELIRDGAVAVSGNAIVFVGKRPEAERLYAPARTIEAPAGLLTPGLIDAHNHPQDYFAKGLADDDVSRVRMGQRIFPYEHSLSDEEAYTASTATFAEMMRHGTTCVCDAGGPTPDGVARAMLDSGIRGVVSTRCNDLPGFMNCPVDGDVDMIVARAERTIERWNGAADGRLRAVFNLDLPANVSDELCALITERARSLDVGIVGHLVGRKLSSDPTRAGRNPDAQRYEELGVLGPDLQLAHIGWLHADDVAAFARADVKTVHCASQSMLGGTGAIAHGVFPELLSAGVTVALGTDAAAISRFLDMVRVMYVAACGHKDARMDPLAMGAYTAFEMATVNGARAIWREHEIGSLEAGRKADLVIFSVEELEWHPAPLGNPIADLVYNASGGAARTVIVDGRIVLDDGELVTIDLEALLPAVDETARTVLDRLGFTVAPKWPVI